MISLLKAISSNLTYFYDFEFYQVVSYTCIATILNPWFSSRGCYILCPIAVFRIQRYFKVLDVLIQRNCYIKTEGSSLLQNIWWCYMYPWGRTVYSLHCFVCNKGYNKQTYLTQTCTYNFRWHNKKRISIIKLYDNASQSKMYNYTCYLDVLYNFEILPNGAWNSPRWHQSYLWYFVKSMKSSFSRFVLFWGCVLLYLCSPKGGCCSILDYLSCSCWNLYHKQLFWIIWELTIFLSSRRVDCFNDFFPEFYIGTDDYIPDVPPSEWGKLVTCCAIRARAASVLPFNVKKWMWINVIITGALQVSDNCRLFSTFFISNLFKFTGSSSCATEAMLILCTPVSID